MSRKPALSKHTQNKTHVAIVVMLIASSTMSAITTYEIFDTPQEAKWCPKARCAVLMAMSVAMLWAPCSVKRLAVANFELLGYSSCCGVLGWPGSLLNASLLNPVCGEHCVKYAGNGTCAQAPHKHSFSRPWSYTTAPSKHAIPRKCTSAWQAFNKRTLSWPWGAHASEKGASTKCGGRLRPARKSRQHPKVFPGGPPP